MNSEITFHYPVIQVYTASTTEQHIQYNKQGEERRGDVKTRAFVESNHS
jgi:hypothetical protein